MHISRSFNRAQSTYDDYCELQNSVGEKLINLVKQYYTKANNIIDLGCGTGATTQKLAAQFCYEKFHAIDNANLLLLKAINRLTPHNIKVYAADFDKLILDHTFDIIFSNMALHWSVELLTTLNNLAKWLNNGGLFAFSLPLPGTLVELNNAYAKNDFIDPEAIKAVLSSANYELRFYQSETTSLHFEDTLSALKSIKNTGANHVHGRKNKSLRGKLFINNSYLNSLSYTIGYFIVKKVNNI